MIVPVTVVGVLDNAGGLTFTCVQIWRGPVRKYGRLGEIIWMVSKTRRVYSQERDKLDELNAARAARIAKRVKKSRKIKAKKKRKPNMRPYIGLLLAIKNITRRISGENLRYDWNKVLTYTEPHKFGPAGKTQNIPNLLGTKMSSPILIELLIRQKLRDKFWLTIKKSRALV